MPWHGAQAVSPGTSRANLRHFWQRVRVTPVDVCCWSSFILFIVHHQWTAQNRFRFAAKRPVLRLFIGTIPGTWDALSHKRASHVLFSIFD